MKRTLLALALGLAAGAVTHFGYYRLHQPCTPDSLECQLTWMRRELRLTDGQYARIRALHESSGPQLRHLADQIARLQQELTAFEETRRTRDTVDFLEFARFVEARRSINRESLDSTRHLVAAAADVMTPDQRRRYFELIASVAPRSALPSLMP